MPDGSVKVPQLTAEEIEERKKLNEERQKREADAETMKKGTKKRLDRSGVVVEVVPFHERTAAKLDKKIRAGSKPPDEEEEDEDKDNDNDNDDDDEEEEEEDGDVDELRAYQERLDKLPDLKAEIRRLATEMLGNPEELIVANAAPLFRLCFHENTLIKQLAVLSLAACYADLMPAYQVKDWDSDVSDGGAVKVQLSKEVRRVRKFEKNFLAHYRKFVDLLKSIMVLKKPIAPEQEEQEKEKHAATNNDQPLFVVKTRKALAQMQLIAAKAINKVLLANPSFNFGEDLLELVIKFANRTDLEDVSELCITTIQGVFAKEMELEQILFGVQKIGALIKQKRNEANPALLRTFLHVIIGEGVGDIDIKSEAERGIRKKDRVHLTRKQKKQRKLDKQVDEHMREAEAGRRKSELQKFQRAMAQSMFLTYFRILKNHTPTSLLPAALEGIARWCHLINVDFMFDIVQTLLSMLQRSSLALAPALYCAITAFQALRNSGDLFRIDLSAYYHYVYPRLLKIPFEDQVPADEQTESIHSIAIRCLQLMLASKTYRMSTRSAAFAKRLATLALHVAPAGAIGLMQLCRQIIEADPKLEQLVDPEEVGSGEVFNPEMEDPDNCHPFSTSLFELHLLQDHYHPHVSLFAKQTLSGASVAPHDPTDYLFSYDFKTQVFNPPLVDPGTDRLEKKWKKLQKYSKSKRRGFLPSLMPLIPEEESPFVKDALKELEEWGKVLHF